MLSEFGERLNLLVYDAGLPQSKLLNVLGCANNIALSGVRKCRGHDRGILSVMQVLGLETDLNKLAAEDA